MANVFAHRSVFGRLLGLTSTGGIKGGSSAVCVEQGPSMVQAATSTATTLNNYGMSVLQSSSTAPAYSISAPAYAGLGKNIYCEATSSAITINGTSTAITFGSTGGDTLTLGGVAGVLRTNAVQLEALSTAKWAVLNINSTANVTITGG